MSEYLSSSASLKPFTLEEFKQVNAYQFPLEQISPPVYLKQFKLDLSCYSLEGCVGLENIKKQVEEMFALIEEQCKLENIPLDKIQIFTDVDYEEGDVEYYCAYDECSKEVLESESDREKRILEAYETYLVRFKQAQLKQFENERQSHFEKMEELDSLISTIKKQDESQ